MEKLGFGKDKLFRMKYRNEPRHVMIGEREFRFKSKLEYRYAQYLEILRGQGHYTSWDYEPDVFTFEDEVRGAKVYTPDFRIITAKGNTEYHECKGLLTGSDVTKFKRMAKYYPMVDITLVFMKSNKRQANRIRTAMKYVRDVKYIGPTLRKLAGLIDMS
ncbi:hypothetical protein LCGC14_0434220 [marine sediment metagenome]|uniref:DUF1064 domain-containing protein n=1 Tax=marine sediment metagenome TaxID=412755 RepID=A0A0F9T592_9ZZZZ